MKKVVECRCRNIIGKALVSMIFAFVCFAAEDGRAVDIGKMRGILTDESSEHDKLAADTLARYLERIYGVKIPVNPDGIKALPDERDIILVGRKTALAAGTITAEELDKVKHDGFVLRAGDGRISLAGYAGRGSVYAAYELLERLGCKFYAPSLEIVPTLETIVIKDIDFADKPFFDYRSGSRWQKRASVGNIGDPRHALNPELFTRETGSTLWFNHTHGYLAPKLLYYDEHPEYFALQRDGERMPDTTKDHQVFLCTTHPDVIRIAVERTLGWMRLQSDRRFFFIGAGDGPGWCQCKKCLALDSVKGVYSDRNIAFVNEIAREVKKEFPDNILMTFAYVGSEYAPKDTFPESNVIVFYAPYFGVGRSMVHTFVHPVNIEALTQLMEWLDVAEGQMAITNYGLWFTPSWDAVAANLKWFAEHNIRAIRLLGSPTCFREMFNYMMARLMWNPYLDPEELKTDFVSAYYGAAAPHIMNYLARLRGRLTEGYPKMVYENSMPPDFYSVEFVHDSIRDFDLAMDAVKEDAELYSRVKKEKDLLLGDYLGAVNLVTDGTSSRGILRTAPTPQQRSQALEFFKEKLQEQIDRCKDMTDKLAEKENVRLADQREKLLSQMRSQLNSFARMKIPDDADVIKVAADFIVDHESVMGLYAVPPRKPEPPEMIDGGIRMTGASFTDGRGPISMSYYCEPRDNVMVIGTKPSPRPHVMRAEFELSSVSGDGAVIRMEGQDADKDSPPTAHIRILVNGIEIYSGECGFVRRGWSWRDFPVKPDMLKAGTNKIEIHNITDGPRVKHGRMDHFWFAMSEVQVLFK